MVKEDMKKRGLCINDAQDRNNWRRPSRQNGKEVEPNIEQCFLNTVRILLQICIINFQEKCVKIVLLHCTTQST